MFARVEFRAEYGFYNEFLNYILSNNINLLSVSKTDFGFCAVCAASDYKNIARLASKFQCRTRITERIGIYFRIIKFVHRKGIFVGGIIFLLLCIFFSDIIWKININCTDHNMDSKIVCQLLENGIYPGSFYTKDKLYYARQQLQKENRDVSFVTLNFYGGILECNIYLRKEKMDYTDGIMTQDIVCALGGVITDMRVYSGFAKVKPGQSVTPGDIMVSTKETDKFGDTYYMDTSAYIEGRCIKNYTVFIPFEKSADIYTGITAGEAEIYLPGYIWKSKKADVSGWEKYTTRTAISYGNFMGFCLPFTIVNTTYFQQRKSQVSSGLTDAIYACRSQIEHLIRRDDKLKKELDREYTYTQNESGINMSCTVEGYYDMS